MPRSELRVRRDGPRRDKGCGRRPGQRAWWGGSFASLPFINAIIIRAVKAAAALAVIFGEAFFFFLPLLTHTCHLHTCWSGLLCGQREKCNFMGDLPPTQDGSYAAQGERLAFCKNNTSHFACQDLRQRPTMFCISFFFGLLRERGRRYDCIRLLFEFKYYSCIFLFYYCRVFCLAETSFSFGL